MATPYEIVDFNDLPPIPCPCGTARRAFADREDYPATIHRTEITADAERHFHKRLTEVYYILDCEADAAMELNEDVIPVKPGMCILIPPGVRHRGVGRMSILNIVLPKFDPADEFPADALHNSGP